MFHICMFNKVEVKSEKTPEDLYNFIKDPKNGIKYILPGLFVNDHFGKVGFEEQYDFDHQVIYHLGTDYICCKCGKKYQNSLKVFNNLTKRILRYNNKKLKEEEDRRTAIILARTN